MNWLIWLLLGLPFSIIAFIYTLKESLKLEPVGIITLKDLIDSICISILGLLTGFFSFFVLCVLLLQELLDKTNKIILYRKK